MCRPRAPLPQHPPLSGFYIFDVKRPQILKILWCFRSSVSTNGVRASLWSRCQQVQKEGGGVRKGAEQRPNEGTYHVHFSSFIFLQLAAYYIFFSCPITEKRERIIIKGFQKCNPDHLAFGSDMSSLNFWTFLAGDFQPGYKMSRRNITL